MIDFNNILFRASANGDIMTPGTGEITEKQLLTLKEYTEKKNSAKGLTDLQNEELTRLINKRDNPTLSTTCIKRLIKIFAQTQGREEEIRSKYMEKGSSVENDAITLYSRVKKVAFFKNTVRLNNKYVTGEPDCGSDPNIIESEEIIDIKSSWSLITFLNAKHSEVNSDYQDQGDTYMGLCPKSKRFRLAYCLVNSPGSIIQQEKKKLQWQMAGEVIDFDNSPEYKEKCRQIEINHIFDIKLFVEQNPGFDFDNDLDTWEWGIPMEKRVFEFVIDRDNKRIDAIYKKIERCRKWMSENFK
jgi:hypothetical protein